MQRVLIVTAILFIIMCVMVPLVGRVKYDDGYKQGQIDALTGSIRYKLEQQQDGTTIWRKIEEHHEPPMQNRTAR